MASERKTNDRLIVAVMIFMAVGIAISLFALWFSIANRSTFENEIKQSLMTELAKYNLGDKTQNVSVDDAKLLLAVAKYCDSRNDCVGANGTNGRNGSDGDDGDNGSNGTNGTNGTNGQDGYTPVKGVDYFDGNDGADGEPAAAIERRCNPDKLRIEWKQADVTNWQVEYKLAPGQTCETEGL